MIEFSKRIALALGLLCLFAGASRADTITIPSNKLVLSGSYYTDVIGFPLVMTGGGANANVGGSENDDGFSGPIPLGFVFNFFGVNYTEFWANNNGNVTFGAGFDPWLPVGLSAIPVPIIAPFFSDVDTIGSGLLVDPLGYNGLMYLRNDIPNEIIVTWNQVGHYNQNTDRLNSFQMVLRSPDFVIPAGEGEVGFFYKSMNWEAGDGLGDNGFGGVPAAIGFGDGNGNEILVEGSMEDLVSRRVTNQEIWFNRIDTPTLFGAPVGAPAQGTVPEPSTLLLVGAGAAILARKLYSRTRQA